MGSFEIVYPGEHQCQYRDTDNEFIADRKSNDLIKSMVLLLGAFVENSVTGTACTIGHQYKKKKTNRPFRRLPDFGGMARQYTVVLTAG